MLKTRFVILSAGILPFATCLAYASIAAVPSSARPARVQPQVRAQGLTLAPARAKLPIQVTAAEPSGESKKGISISQLGTDDRLLQLHIAEYQALTIRTTNWTTLQYGLITFAVTALALIIANWSLFSSGFRVWAIAILYQSVMIAHLLVLSELFNNVRYQECELRPRVERLLLAGIGDEHASRAQAQTFWHYEQYMKSHSAYGPTGDYLLVLQSLLAMLLAAWFRRWYWSRLDLLWCSFSFIAFLSAVYWTYAVVAVHMKFLECAGQ